MQRNATLGWIWVVAQFVGLIIFVLMPWRETNVMWFILGAFLVAVGLLIGALAFVSLGNALTPTPVPRELSGLKTGGVYAYVRHPIYVALIVCMLGWVIAIGSWLTVLVGIVMIGFFAAKSRWEDRLLAEAYGDEWRAWAARVGAFFPQKR